MKKHILLLSVLFMSAGFLLTSCKKGDYVDHATFYRPVFKSKAEVRAAIKSGPVRDIIEAGKIFIQGNYLFLVDVNRGVHVIDITNIQKPHKIAFILVPGCNDIAVRGTFLYADLSSDLVTLDISNPAHATLKKSIPNVFPSLNYFSNTFHFIYNPDTTKMLADWVRVDTSFVHSSTVTKPNNSNILYFASASNASTSAAVTNGTGGSLSRFGLLNERMYTVGYSYINIFNTADAGNPIFVKQSPLNQGSLETIFPYKNTLFIGSQTGMFIYDANNPDNPAKLSQFQHIRLCDPVVADDQNAYVTLHSGTNCGGFTNQLDVLDITSLTNPVFIKTYNLTSPRGLAKDGNLLLICDDKDGLKIFNAADAANISLIKTVSDQMIAQDVIVYKNTAIVTATNGLYFVDYSNPANAKTTSIISINN